MDSVSEPKEKDLDLTSRASKQDNENQSAWAACTQRALKGIAHPDLPGQATRSAVREATRPIKLLFKGLLTKYAPPIAAGESRAAPLDAPFLVGGG